MNATEPELRIWIGWNGLPARPVGPLARRNDRNATLEKGCRKKFERLSRSERRVAARDRRVACATRPLRRHYFGVRAEPSSTDSNSALPGARSLKGYWNTAQGCRSAAEATLGGEPESSCALKGHRHQPIPASFRRPFRARGHLFSTPRVERCALNPGLYSAAPLGQKTRLDCCLTTGN